MRFAKKTDMPRIMEIWQQCFGDTKEEIAQFFSAFAGSVQVAVLEEEGRIVGQLCLIPASLCLKDGSKLPIFYLYAVATATAYRGRGICTRLLLETTDWLKESKAGAVLVPAEESLISFYGKRGFTCCFAGAESLIRRNWQEERLQQEKSRKEKSQEECGLATEPQAVRCISGKEYVELRQQALRKKTHVEVSQDYLEYALLLHGEAGGICAKLSFDGREYGVLYRLSSDAPGRVEIREITAATEAEALCVARKLLAALSMETAALRYSYLTMGIELSENLSGDGYFNLVLD